MAEKSANVGHRKDRKRKRTEKGRDWDKEIGEETLSGKQPSDVLSITGPDSGKNDMQTSKSPKENPHKKRKKLAKPEKNNRKSQKKSKCRKLLSASLEKKQEKQKENQTQKTAEIVAGKKKTGKAKRKASAENH